MGRSYGAIGCDSGLLRLPFGTESKPSELSTCMLWLRLRRGGILQSVAKVASINPEQPNREEVCDTIRAGLMRPFRKLHVRAAARRRGH